MFKGKVLRTFVDRITKKRYRAGSTYETDSEDRMKEIAAAGEARGRVYVEFEGPVPEGNGSVSIEKMTVPELQAFAKSAGIELTKTRKADIITEIEAALDDGS